MLLGWRRGGAALLIVVAFGGGLSRGVTAQEPEADEAAVSAEAEILAVAAQPPAPQPSSPPAQPKSAPTRPAAPKPPAAAERSRPAPAPAVESLAASTSRAPATGTAILRLASVPNMFGDFFHQGGQFETKGGNLDAVSDLPAAGGGPGTRIAENNKALPMDRVFLMYHHYHNALTADLDPLNPGNEQDFSVDRYTLGLEKTFFDGRWSVDLRLPFYNSYEFQAGGFGVEGGAVGNVSVMLKRLLRATDEGALAAGLTIGAPTGSDVRVQDGGVHYTLENQAVHLAPFIGFLRLPSECLFYQGFLQLDVPTNGNRIDYLDTGGGLTGSLGTLTDQTALYVDLSAGYWLYRDPHAFLLTGVASLVEFHYATGLGDADVVSGTFGGTTVRFGDLQNPSDVANVTVGLHTELRGHTTLRVGGVFPLQDSSGRPFDAELHVMLDRFF